MFTPIDVKETPNNKSEDANKTEPLKKKSIASKIARWIGRNPRKALAGSFIVSTIFSYIGIVVGNFEIAVDNDGWRSRGTIIANREMQNEVVLMYRNALFNDMEGIWERLQENVQICFTAVQGIRRRNLQVTDLDNCDVSRYSNDRFLFTNLFAAYKTESSEESTSVSILNPDVLLQICEAESATNQALEENGVCGGCQDNKCLPPLSLILVLRSQLNGFEMTCDELIQVYTEPVQEAFVDSLVACTNDILETFDPIAMIYSENVTCPTFFFPSMVDNKFGLNGNTMLRHSSSYFITDEYNGKDTYDFRSQFGKTDGKLVSSTYDTYFEEHNEIYVDSILASDMSLALASLMVTFTAMCIHTKSIWLTVIGILQLFYAVPLSYFFYTFICGLDFFPFLNFIGVFVAAALGADGVFVAVDKFKNARIDNPHVSTEDVAAIALPDAASAMLLTTSTTAVAFFATTICPVTPILCFALFCGLMITFNYILNIIFIFPSLCLYDIWLMKGSRNCLVNFNCCKKSKKEDYKSQESSAAIDENGETNGNGSLEQGPLSPIHKIFSFYFFYLNKFRKLILILCVVVMCVCAVVAASIKLPDSVNVRLLPKNNPFEQHFFWKAKLLSQLLFIDGATFGKMHWGIRPADTGKRNDPDSLTQLVLDDNFNPKSEDAQNYLLGFCDKLFAEDFARPKDPSVKCPINRFDDWLGEQADNDDLDNDEYLSSCNNADSLPMPEDDFGPCLVAWSKLYDERNFLSNNGELKIMQLSITLNIAWDAPYAEMDTFWSEFENWMSNEREIAPPGVKNMFNTAPAFWWYDTNASMLMTAIGATGIALSFSTIVVLFASRSLVLTLFSCLSIFYVLAATTASLVGFGWSLGFLESVCFAILIGISCDFVIHFGHAYNHHKGVVSRTVRSKFALLHMGPSILAASTTTITAALVMLFCTVTFFQKFALILLMTILHATIASFIFYLVCTTSFGPSEPTKLIDGLALKCKKKCCGS